MEAYKRGLVLSISHVLGWEPLYVTYNLANYLHDDLAFVQYNKLIAQSIHLCVQVAIKQLGALLEQQRDLPRIPDREILSKGLGRSCSIHVQPSEQVLGRRGYRHAVNCSIYA